MAYPSSKRRRTQWVSSQLQQELYSSHLQASPYTLPSLPPSSVVPSLSQSQTSSSSSHARRPRYDPSDPTRIPKKGRGTLKGLKVAKRAKESSNGKLPIEFSTRLGGPIGIHHREFVDYVVVQMKLHVRPIRFFKWSEVPLEIKNTIKDKVLDMWILADDDFARSKIFNIAQRRYRGWMSTFSATYRAYKDDPVALIQNCPEELDLDEWKKLILYFETPDYKRISSRNSENRKKQGSKHHTGSKSLSQVSFENRDKDTQEEPDYCTLRELANCVEGKWNDNKSKRIHDEVKKKIAEKEAKESRSLSSNECDRILHSGLGKKSGHVRGWGYIAKTSTSAKRVEGDERDELNGKIQQLEGQLEVEHAAVEYRVKAIVEYRRTKEEYERAKEEYERAAEVYERAEEVEGVYEIAAEEECERAKEEYERAEAEAEIITEIITAEEEIIRAEEENERAKEEYKRVAEAKEEYERAKERATEYKRAKEEYKRAKEEYDRAKEAYDRAKEEYESATEELIAVVEYRRTKEEYERAKEEYERVVEELIAVVEYRRTKEEYKRAKEEYERAKEELIAVVEYERAKEEYERAKEEYERAEEELIAVVEYERAKEEYERVVEEVLKEIMAVCEYKRTKEEYEIAKEEYKRAKEELIAVVQKS